MESKPVLLIRADANSEIGAGHVMRCLALAQAWRRSGGKSVFVMAEGLPSLEERLRIEGIEVARLNEKPGSDEDARRVSKLAVERDAFWLVVDGYHFGESYARALKASSRPVLALDDYALGETHSADLLLDQNFGARAEMYGRSSDAGLLLGSQYVLLREEFERWREWVRPVGTASRVLVAVGGADSTGLGRVAARALQHAQIPGVEVRLVTDSASRTEDAEEPAIGKDSGLQVLRSVPDMSEHLAWSDLVVLCGGGILWESLFMCCAVLSYYRSSVQQKVIEALAKSGAVVGMGDVAAATPQELMSGVGELLADARRRADMQSQGRRLVDGLGAARVVAALRSRRSE